MRRSELRLDDLAATMSGKYFIGSRGHIHRRPVRILPFERGSLACRAESPIDSEQGGYGESEGREVKGKDGQPKFARSQNSA